MRDYLIEADRAETALKIRRPFQLLQEFQCAWNYIMSSSRTATPSSPSLGHKTITAAAARQKRQTTLANSTRLSSQTKIKPLSSSLQSVPSKISSQGRVPQKGKDTVIKNQSNMPVGCKNKIPESSDLNRNNVGSLTSSPKWSHIKNKFESTGNVSTKVKLGKSISLPPKDDDSPKLKPVSKGIPSKSLTTLISDGVSRNGNINSEKDLSLRKSTNFNTKTSCIKDLKTDNSHLKSDRESRLIRGTSQCTNSFLHSKEKKLNYPKKSYLNSAMPLSSKTPSFNSSEKTDSTSYNQRFDSSAKESYDDKPVLTFKGEKPPHRTNSFKIDKKASFSDINQQTYNNVSKRDKLNEILSYSNDKNNISLNENANKSITNEQEKITNLVAHKSSQDKSGKTIWVKDSSGNWTKKSVNDNSESLSNSHSKVAFLCNKFNDTNKDSPSKSQPLAKSMTTSNVPSRSSIAQPDRSLAKSSTTSNICDKKCNKLSVSENIQNGKRSSIINNKEVGTVSDKMKATNHSSVPQSKSKSADDVCPEKTSKLNLVQRAVLSYEGNLSLLSPETRKRLKLLSEKIKAQTDDDKLLVARGRNDPLYTRNYRNFNTSSSPHTGTKTENGLQKRTNYNSSELGECVQPVRSFLTRYQQMNRADSKASNRNSCNIPKQENSTASSIPTKFIKGALSGTNLNKNDRESIMHKFSKEKSIETTVNPTLGILKDIKQCTRSDRIKTDDVSSFPAVNTRVKCDPVLLPNSSFLWRNSDATSSELSKSSTTSSVSLASSDFKIYQDVENYYSSVEVEIEKRSEGSDEPIYIDSQGSGGSDSCYSSNYQPFHNISQHPDKISADEGWSDISEDEQTPNNFTGNQSSTLKRKKNKRYSTSQKDYLGLNLENQTNFSHKYENKPKTKLANDTISFTDSSDTLINDEVENESTFDLTDSNHFYEPVYESLGNYLLSDDNCSISLSPDDDKSADLMQSSMTSIESIENLKHDDDQTVKSHPDSGLGTADSELSSVESKKPQNKISQLKRHLSWTKNDIRLELSSKFNKIKIKKNFQNSTEIGVKVHESESVSTSPKKKTFIKCILRQKSANSIPVKRSPSPKKESALFYVHLSMGRQKQRPFSEPISTDGQPCASKSRSSQTNKQIEPFTVPASVVPKPTRQLPKVRKFSSGPIVQRPKTPPPLPPTTKSSVKTVANESKSSGLSSSPLSLSSSIKSGLNHNRESINGFDTCAIDEYPNYQEIYAVLDPEFCSLDSGVSSNGSVSNTSNYEESKFIGAASNPYLSNDHVKFSRSNGNVESSGKTNSITYGKIYEVHRPPSSLLLPFVKFASELLKSPFEEEPMYQFYHKDVQQRATLWYTADGSESEFDDDSASKLSENENPPIKPVLQSQLSAMDLVLGEGGLRTLWCEVPEVMSSGILETTSSQDRKIQEAMFEVITSEASYLKSLNFLLEHFVACPEFSGDFTEKHVLDKRERHILFSDIQPVRDVSARLLADLEKRWLENIVLSNVSDIIYYHASSYFSVYVKYCSNQLYQERTLKELKDKRPEFVSVLKRLESNPICQSLDMHSFLMLPMQRITRLPLLIDAIFHRLSVDSPIYSSCKMALAMLNKIVAECNEGARKMERMEEMLVISQQLDFKECKGFGLLSASRWLVKKGELVQLMLENSSRRTFGRAVRWCKIQLYLFLFTDLLVVTRRKGDDTYSVVDYCPRNMVQVVPVDENTPPLLQRLPSSYRNIFQMIMLNNKEGKTVEMLLSCLLESDRTRWVNAVTPAKSENPDEKIYEEWDCPQVQCTHAYIAQQPDELSLEETDVVNVFKKMTDGWFEGERIRDGVRGWFPSSHSVEIINSHVRARNLHQRYRLLMLSQTYLEEQYKAQTLHSKK